MPHYEVYERYGFRESLIGRRETKRKALALALEWAKAFGVRCRIRRVDL